jgi:DNA-binding transcriptional LysR family regulator
METKWLEDFIALAETRSFSRAAQLRHVTQPAFSRRIQALEAWTGIDLVDRSSYPTRLTPAGETFHGQALEIVGALQATRNMMRSHQAAGQDMIEFAVPHTLAFTFFPHWLTSLRPQFGALKSRLNAFNVHDAVMRLTEGGCDLLIAYHHPSQPLQLEPDRYEMLSLGAESLAPYARPGPDGQPLLRLPALPGRARALPELRAGGLHGAPGRRDPEERRPAAAAGPGLRDRHGRRPEGDGARRAWPGLPAGQLGAQGAEGPAPGARRRRRALRADHGRAHLPRAPDMARHTKPQAAALWDFLAAR